MRNEGLSTHLPQAPSYVSCQKQSAVPQHHAHHMPISETVCPKTQSTHEKKTNTLNIQLFPHNVQQWIDPSLMDFVDSPSEVCLNQTKQVCNYLVKWQKKTKTKKNIYQLKILIDWICWTDTLVWLMTHVSKQQSTFIKPMGAKQTPVLSF